MPATCDHKSCSASTTFLAPSKPIASEFIVTDMQCLLCSSCQLQLCRPSWALALTCPALFNGGARVRKRYHSTQLLDLHVKR